MDPFLGEVRIFAGSFAPTGWAICDGRLLKVQDYEALFALLGTTYGGDGKTTFALPNLSGRVPVHKGKGPALTETYALGASFGSDTVALTASNVPPHSHALMAVNLPATTSAVGNTVLPATSNGGFYTPAGSPKFTKIALSSSAVSMSTGSTLAAAHDNSMPTIALTYIIALIGLYPVSQ